MPVCDPSEKDAWKLAPGVSQTMLMHLSLSGFDPSPITAVNGNHEGSDVSEFRESF